MERRKRIAELADPELALERLRSTVEERIWAFVTEEGRLGDYWDDIRRTGDIEVALSSLIGGIERLETLMHQPHQPRTDRARTEVSGDSRAEALSEVLAAELARSEDVRQFRKNELDDELVQKSGIWRWVEERYQPASSDERTVSLSYPIPGLEEWWFEHPDNGFLPVGGTNSLEVPADSTLGRLAILGKKISASTSWNSSGAVSFVLAGAVPHLPIMWIETYWRLEGQPMWIHPKQATIRLEINLRVAPSEVARTYARERAEMISTAWSDQSMGSNTRDRDLSERPLNLAITAARLNDGRTWPQAMADWNKTCDAREQYSDPRAFSRECRRAYFRVTGARLRWMSERARQAHSRP